MNVRNLLDVLRQVALVAAKLNGSDSAKEGYMALTAVVITAGLGAATLCIVTPAWCFLD